MRRRADVVQVTAGRFRGLVGDQLDDADTADDADVADGAVRRQRFEPAPQPALELLHFLDGTRFLDQLEARDRHRAGQRIGRERVAVKEGPRAICR